MDCKVREANFRCGLEAGDEETVLGGDGGTRFQYYQTNKTKKNNTLIIPLSDWTNIYFASILADSAFSSICVLISSCPLIPGSNSPVYVSGVAVYFNVVKPDSGIE
jgi:hypothetical protein